MTAALPLLFVALLVAVIGLSVYRVAPPGLVQIARIAFGAALGIAAVWALVAKQFAIAVGLAALALALLRPLVEAARATPSPGRTSEVRTDALVMTLDHDTGAMDGEVLAGRFTGRRLSELAPAELQALFDELEADEESTAILMTYLERRSGGGGGDRSDGGAGAASPPDPAGMSEAEAYRVLGLAPGASREEVRAAHHRLIKKVHPDLGGSPTLAALINAAKERLDPG